EAMIQNMHVDERELLSGETIVSDFGCVDMIGAAIIVLSAVQAIDNGLNDGQEITVRQTGTGSTQIDNNANVLNSGGNNVILTQGSSITYTWSERMSRWLEKSRSII